jgi:Protein of unknown function (DUF2800)
MSAHAACSPSSATMWLACPASVTKTKDVVRPSSKYAREGTAAHMVAEMSLKGDIFLPDKVTAEGEEFIVSRGMCQALNPYVTHVQGLMRQWGARIFLEQRLYIPHTYKMVWGTMDCGVYSSMRGNLDVVDLKFGKGHFVEADTPQLKLYALGFAHLVDEKNPDTPVSMTICQPRVGDTPVRSHVMTLGELWEWSYAEVRPAIERIKAGDKSEIAGPHCRWCVRKTECAAFARKHQTQAAAVFDDPI